MRLRHLVAPVVTTLVLGACSATSPSSGPAAFVDVPVVDSGGAERTLAELDGGVVLVNFWASYCKPCAAEMPLLQELSETYDDVEFVGINALDERDDAAALLERTGVDFTIWYDDRGDAMFAADVSSLPATFILDADGTVVHRVLGEVTRSSLAAALDAATGS